MVITASWRNPSAETGSRTRDRAGTITSGDKVLGVDRRAFVTSTVGTTLLAATGLSGAQRSGGGEPVTPDLFVWRQYSLRTGTGPRRLADYLQNAYIPALNRLEHKPIGVFEVLTGLAAPTVFVLTPASTQNLSTIDSSLERDEQFLRAATAYFEAPPTDPVYARQEVSLLTAFPKFPRIEVPSATATNGPRLFELRIYESHNERAHRAKVRMFDEMGEIEIFRRAGLTPVFFSRTVAGQRMPSLVYMLVHESFATRDKSWDAFRNDPEWKKLSATPGYTDAEIVSNITTVLLRPAAYSQV